MSKIADYFINYRLGIKPDEKGFEEANKMLDELKKSRNLTTAPPLKSGGAASNVIDNIKNSPLADAAKGFASSFIKGVVIGFSAVAQTFTSGVASGSKKIIAIGSSMAKEFIVTLYYNAKYMIKLGVDAAKAFIDTVSSGAKLLVKHGANAAKSFLGTVTQNANNVVDLGVKAANSFIDIVTAGAHAVVNIGANTGYAFIRAMASGATAIVNFGTGMATNFINTVASGASVLAGFVANSAKVLISSVSVVSRGLITGGYNAGKALVRSVANAAGVLVNAAKWGAGAVSSAVTTVASSLGSLVSFLSKGAIKVVSVVGKGLVSAGGGIAKGLFSVLGAGGRILAGLGGMVAKGFIGAMAVGGAVVVASLTKGIEKDTATFRRDRMNKQGTNGTGWSSEQMDVMAKQMVETGVFTETAAIKAQSLAMAFRNIKGDQFKKVLELSADVAVVMGKDLPEATQELSAALDDPVKAAEGGLEHLGVQFGLQEQSIIRSKVAARDYAGAQDLILQKLESFRGSAGEFAKRPAGQWMQLSAKVEMLATKIGDLLIPILLKVTNFFIGLADGANNAFDNIETAWDLAWAYLDLGFKELVISAKGSFQDLLIGFRATMAALGAAASYTWKEVKYIFGQGVNPGSIGSFVEDAFVNEVARLEETIKNGTSKERAKIEELKKKLVGKKEEQQKKDKDMLAKPAGDPTAYVNTKAKFQFETSGFAEMSKKIQSQIIPNSFEEKMNIQIKLNEQQIVVAKEHVEVGKRLLNVVSLGKEAGAAKFGK